MSDTMKIPKPVPGGTAVRPLTPPASKSGRGGTLSGGTMGGCTTCLTKPTKPVPKPKLNGAASE